MFIGGVFWGLCTRWTQVPFQRARHATPLARPVDPLDFYSAPAIPPCTLVAIPPFLPIALHLLVSFPSLVALTPPPPGQLSFPFLLSPPITRPLCQPAERTVVVVNGDPRAPLTMLSLSSDLDDFHCSWFQDAIVPPGGNTSFTVVYLARSVGHLEGSITLSTSAGDVHFEVSARCA